jgi:ectoine hydroxylase-related dioxygenase (phytanoyl-CoA dioxygenase family)
MNVRFDKDAPQYLIQNALKTHGFVIVKNVLSEQDLTELNEQIADHLEKTQPDDVNAFNGSKTKRFGALLHRVPKTHELVQSFLVRSLLDDMLLPLSPRYKVFFTGVMHLTEGQQAQVLHRDNTPFENPAPSVVIASMYAATEFKRDNGATVLVPGSHLWREDREPTKEELFVAEMSAGSVLFYVGNIIHGAGTCDNGSRTGVSLQYAVSWLQQEENQALVIPHEYAKQNMNEELLKLAGFDIIARNYGADGDARHPIDTLYQRPRMLSVAPEGSSFSNGTVKTLQLEAKDVRTADHHYHVKL